MTRKLCSLLISSFAVLLLMGAGVEEDSAALVDESGSESVQTAAARVGAEEQAEPASAVSGESVLSQVEEVDPTLTVDGQPVSTDVAKTYRGDTTYVALVPMSKCLDSTILSKWDAGTRTATVHNDKLVLKATVGNLYLTVNNRYFYAPEGIQIENGQVMVPLSALVKAFDGSLTWNGSTGITAVTRGSGAAKFGEQYYNADDLFWLSRVIYTESGNQPLEGKMAVGNVVMNRVKHPSFPGTIEGVLAQKNQFTTYWSGHIARSTPNAESVIAAKLVLDGGVVEEVKNALYFDSAANSWASRNRTCVAVIGGHRFYA
ncbi:MAG TPA: cell wall hydrolase [Candidatus Lawsonibacter pullicola]|nr:cell wall hydrolase [Oscillospiraceae bacterium]HIW26525.1 cell wall hydrolase [Candidatus Lawsonibacter pullicola]